MIFANMTNASKRIKQQKSKSHKWIIHQLEPTNHAQKNILKKICLGCKNQSRCDRVMAVCFKCGHIWRIVKHCNWFLFSQHLHQSRVANTYSNVNMLAVCAIEKRVFACFDSFTTWLCIHSIPKIFLFKFSVTSLI